MKLKSCFLQALIIEERFSMGIIALDEDFYAIDKYGTEKDYLQILLSFVRDKTTLDIAVFTSEEFNNSSLWFEKNHVKVAIMKKVMRTGRGVAIKDSDIDTLNKKTDTFLALAESKHKADVKQVNGILSLNHVEHEFRSNMQHLIENGYVPIIKPTNSKPLPNSDLCCKFKEFVDILSEGCSEKELQALYQNAATEVLHRNGYNKNTRVTKLNPGVAGGVYAYGKDCILYASADIEHGGIEVFDHRGFHKGEYTYEGTLRKGKDKKGHHNIIV